MFEKNREFLKAYPWTNKAITSPQELGEKQPEAFKRSDAVKIPLPEFNTLNLEEKSFSEIIQNRRSHRKFTKEALSLQELSYMLHISYGITKTTPQRVLRSAPSGGNRQTLETYVVILNVEGLQQGVYLYLPLDHALVFEKNIDNMEDDIVEACKGQAWVKQASFVLVWTVIPARGEWRYTDKSHKLMLLDAGHLCQNVYLGAEAIGLGTCAIAAYNQDAMDAFLGVDGKEEFTIYLAPIGSLESVTD